MKYNKFILLFFAIASINQFNYCSHHKSAQQLAIQFTQESYISPEMQWTVLSLNKPEFVVINTQTGSVQGIQTIESMLTSITQQIDPQAPSIDIAQKESMKNALHTMLEATEIAMITTSIKIAYKNNEIMPFAQQLPKILQEQQQAVQNMLNRLAAQPTSDLATQSSSYFSWWNNKKTEPFSTEKSRIDTHNPNLTIIPVSLMETLARTNDYKTKPNAVQAANLLYKQCFIAQQKHTTKNHIPLNVVQPFSINNYIFTNCPDLYNKINDTYPICEQIIQTHGKNSLPNLLEIRQAIQTALYIANKNSIINIGYLLPTSITSYLDGIVSQLIQYDTHLATLCTNPLYGATRANIAQANQWSTVTKLAIGAIGVAAVGGAILTYDPQAYNKTSQFVSESATGAMNWFNGSQKKEADRIAQEQQVLKIAEENEKARLAEIARIAEENRVAQEQARIAAEEEARIAEQARLVEIARLEKQAADKAETARLHLQLKEFQDQSAEIARREIEIQKKLAAEQQARDELQAHNELMKKIGIGATGLGILGLGAVSSYSNQPTKDPQQKPQGSILMNAAQRHANNQTPVESFPQYKKQSNKQPEQPSQKTTIQRNEDGSKIIIHEYADGTSMQVFVDKDWKIEYKVKIDPRQIPYVLTFMTDQDQKFLVRKIYSDESLSETKFNPITGDLIDITYSHKFNESHPPMKISCTIQEFAIAYLNFQLEPGATQENIEKRYKSLSLQHDNNPELLEQIGHDTRMLRLHATHPDPELTIAINSIYQKLLPEYTQATLQEVQPQSTSAAQVQPTLTGEASNIRYYGGNEVKGGDFGDID